MFASPRLETAYCIEKILLLFTVTVWRLTTDISTMAVVNSIVLLKLHLLPESLIGILLG
jgi:hypothetical protein